MDRSCSPVLRWIGRATLATAACCAVGAPVRELGSQPRPVVYLIPVEGMIDLGLAPFVQRMLAQAERDRAAAVVLDINTLGGRVDAAVLIRDALLAAPTRTVAFVDRRAISAGALIALAAERIAMADGGTIGAATPVQLGSGSAQTPVDEKSVSYVRKEFRATAESRNRPPIIAEAMVDADVAITGVVARGKLLTLTTDEALELGVADLRARDVTDLVAQLGLAGATVHRVSPNWGERVLRLVTHPMVASLLMTFAMLGILIELRTPGFGVPGVLGIASLALLLGSHWIVHLVGWEELLLVGAGLVLLALEVFVIPGFGIAGIAGIVALAAGLTMSLIGEGATIVAIAAAAGRVAIAVVGSIIAGLLLLRYLPQVPIGRRLMLDTELAAASGYASAPQRDEGWLGHLGRATTPLRPAGIAEFDGERVDVVSDGEMIEAGARIVVWRVDGNRIVVRRHQPIAEGAQP